MVTEMVKLQYNLYYEATEKNKEETMKDYEKILVTSEWGKTFF